MGCGLTREHGVSRETAPTRGDSFAQLGPLKAQGAGPLSGVTPSIVDCIGNTPLIRLRRMQGPACPSTILLKMESENPAKSVKDRLALAVVLENEKNGILTPGKNVLIEATSGNTGVALAMVGASRGYRVILVMPEHVSLERRCLVAAYGAELVLTPRSLGMKGSLYKAECLAKEIGEDAFLTEQFSTEYNAKVHRETTGREIWEATLGQVGVLVAGVGTGGTLVGCAQYFKEMNADVKVVAVEPTESAVLSGGKPGPHTIQGMGPGFVAKVVDRSVITATRTVSSEDALAMARRLPREEGVFTGISAGAIVQAAIEEAHLQENCGKMVVCIIPSYGERYLSTVLYRDLWDECLAMDVMSEEEASPPEGWTSSTQRDVQRTMMLLHSSAKGRGHRPRSGGRQPSTRNRIMTGKEGQRGRKGMMDWVI